MSQPHPLVEKPPPNAADLRAEVARLQVPVYRLGALVGMHPGRLGMLLRGSIPLSNAVALRIGEALDALRRGAPADKKRRP